MKARLQDEKPAQGMNTNRNSSFLFLVAAASLLLLVRHLLLEAMHLFLVQASAKLMPNSRLRPEIYVFQHVNAVLGKSCLSHAFHASPKQNATVFGAVRSLNSIFWQLLQTAFHGLHAMPIAKRFGRRWISKSLCSEPVSETRTTMALFGTVV